MSAMTVESADPRIGLCALGYDRPGRAGEPDISAGSDPIGGRALPDLGDEQLAAGRDVTLQRTQSRSVPADTPTVAALRERRADNRDDVEPRAAERAVANIAAHDARGMRMALAALA